MRQHRVLVCQRRKLQTPGNAVEHKKQETPTINPIGPTDKPHRPSTEHYRKDSRVLVYPWQLRAVNEAQDSQRIIAAGTLA